MAIAGILKQSTAATIVLGPFLDDTDGKTAKNAASPVARLSKNAGAFAARSDATAIANMENGYYTCVLNATDTNTLGRLCIGGTGTASLPVRQDYFVVTTDEWDRQFDTVGAVPAMGIIDRGTAQSATSTTLVLRSAAPSFGNSTPIGATLMAFGATQNYWQTRSVTAFTNSTLTATVDAWTVTPSGSPITYVLLAGAPASATVVPAVNATQFAGQTITAAAGVTLPATVASTTNITAGTITTATNVTTVNGIAANVVTASALATDAVTEIANAVVEAEIDALETYSRTTNTAATITGPTSGSNALTITTDAAYEPIKSIT
jgi:hypothetical protein